MAAQVAVDVSVELLQRGESGRVVTVTLTAGATVLSEQLASGETATFGEVPSGLVEVAVAAAGFEGVTETHTIADTTAWRFRLLPAAPIRVAGEVVTTEGAPATAARIRLTGLAGRGGVVLETQAGSGGAFELGSVPPGYYRLEASLAEQQVELEQVELLAATELAVVLRPQSERPDITLEKRACAAGAGYSSLGWLLAVTALRRRRWS